MAFALLGCGICWRVAPRQQGVVSFASAYRPGFYSLFPAYCFLSFSLQLYGMRRAFISIPLPLRLVWRGALGRRVRWERRRHPSLGSSSIADLGRRTSPCTSMGCLFLFPCRLPFAVRSACLFDCVYGHCSCCSVLVFSLIWGSMTWLNRTTTDSSESSMNQPQVLFSFLCLVKQSVPDAPSLAGTTRFRKGGAVKFTMPEHLQVPLVFPLIRIQSKLFCLPS